MEEKIKEVFVDWRSWFCCEAKLSPCSNLCKIRSREMINVFMAYIPQQTTSLCVWGTQKGDNLLTKSHEEAYIYTLKKEKKEKKKNIYIYVSIYKI